MWGAQGQEDLSSRFCFQGRMGAVWLEPGLCKSEAKWGLQTWEGRHWEAWPAEGMPTLAPRLSLPEPGPVPKPSFGVLPTLLQHSSILSVSAPGASTLLPGAP